MHHKPVTSGFFNHSKRSHSGVMEAAAERRERLKALRALKEGKVDEDQGQKRKAESDDEE